MQGMPQPQGPHLARPAVGLRVVGDIVSMRLDGIAESNDKVACGHGLLRGWRRGLRPASLEEGSESCQITKKYYPIGFSILTPLVR